MEQGLPNPAVKNPLIDQFLDDLWLESGVAEHTLSAYSTDLNLYSQWLCDRHQSLDTVTKDDCVGYLAWRLDQGHAASSLARLVSCWRRFYGWLLLKGRISRNPVAQLEQPRTVQKLPMALSETDVSNLLAAPDVSQPLGVRDRAMMEVMYAAGLRVSELVNLTLDGVRLSAGVVRVLGKGSKERLVPLGEEAIHWLNEYLTTARAQHCRSDSCEWVFLSQKGVSMSRQGFWYRIKRYAQQAGVSSAVSPHTLRHAFATHLVNHGADLRVVQLLLGHADLSTTQIYTHVAQVRLQSMHAKHHPRG